MQQGRWIAAGFVAGLVVAGGVFLWLRDDAARTQEQARAAELKAQVDRLESAVTKLSMLANNARTDAASSTRVSAGGAAAPTPPAKEKDQSPAQLKAVAEADALVDIGLQSGRWTPEQQEELGAALTDLDAQEQGRILARVSKAINDGQLHFDLRR